MHRAQGLATTWSFGSTQNMCKILDEFCSFLDGRAEKAKDKDGFKNDLRRREGHGAPPARLRYYGARGEAILSAGQDSGFKVFSTVTDLLHRSLGHASFDRKRSRKHRRDMKPIPTNFFLETVLAPGDVLYMPRGTIHQGNCLPEEHSLTSLSPATSSTPTRTCWRR